MNGVIRTGTSRGNARLYRSAHRQGYGRGIGNDVSIGFRLVNGVYRGSCYVRTERCPRSSTKNTYYTHNMSGGTVGFR